MAFHPGITLHKLPVHYSWMVAVLLIAVVWLFVAGMPSLKGVILGTVVLGAVICILLFRWNREHKIEINDLSILEEPADKTPKN